MDKVKVTLDQLRRLAELSIQNGTERAWIEVALQWMSQAVAKIAELEVKCESCGGSGLDHDDHNYQCMACLGSGFMAVPTNALPTPPREPLGRVTELVNELQREWDEMSGYPDTMDERLKIEGLIKALTKQVSKPRCTFDVSPETIKKAAVKKYGDCNLSAPYWVDEEIMRFGIQKDGVTFGANYHYREGIFR
jgi:hypothetical protein